MDDSVFRPHLDAIETVRGRFFDPHNHLGGVLPYRVLWFLVDPDYDKEAMAASPGRLGAAFLSTAAFLQAVRDAEGLGHVDDAALAAFLAHHVVGGHVLKPDGTWRPPEVLARFDGALPPPDADLARRLYRAEARLMWRLLSVVRVLHPAVVKDDRPRFETGSGSVPAILDVLFGTPLGQGLFPAMTDDEILALPDPVGRAEGCADARHLKRVLRNLLTTTPLTDFDSAYAARSALPIRPEDLVRASLDELDRQGVRYVEMSQPLSFWRRKREAPGAAMHARVDAVLRAHRVTLRWLPMWTNTDVASAGAFAKFSGVVMQRLEQVTPEHLGGFDVAAPEIGVYAPQVADGLRAMITATGAMAERLGRPLVAHVHAGEGFAPPKAGRAAVEALVGRGDVAAEPAPDQVVRQARTRSGENVGRVIQALRGWPGRPGGDVLRVRLGHVTNASGGDVEAMARLGIAADVNLTSNLATGAALRVGDRVEDLKRAFRSGTTMAILDRHPLPQLVANGVETFVGTDGGGVEHSSMPVEWLLAGLLLARRGGDLAALAETQAAHVRRMTGDAG